MIRYTISMLGEQTDHPLLMGIFLLALLFLGSSLIVDQVTGQGLVGGFLMVYAIIAAFMGALGYALIYLGKFVNELQWRYLHK